MKNIILFLLIIGCERSRVIHPPAKPSEEISIYLFAAGYCEPCKEEIPAIEKWFINNKRPNERLTIFLVAGKTPSSHPNTAACEEFTKETGIKSAPVPDKYGKIYRRYYSDGIQIPATVIVNKYEEAIKVFKPGKITPQELEAVLR